MCGRGGQAGGGEGWQAADDGGGETHRRVTFQCQLYNAFYYAGALLWGNTAMKKEEDVETNGGGRKGQEKKEIALPGFHIESLRSSGTFTPSRSTPSVRPSRRPSATSSDIKLFIVHNGASSFVKSKKKKRNINGRNRWWRRRRRERPPAACAEKGCFVKFVDLPRRRSSFPWPPSVPRPLFLSFFFYFSERGSMTGARSILRRRFTAKRGSETRNTDGNLHS